MHFLKKTTLALLCLTAFCTFAAAQNVLTAELKDETTGEPISFATVSLYQKDAKSAYKYALSTEDGKVSISGVRKGEYTLKAELLGYKMLEKAIKIPDNNALGVLKMAQDLEQLDAAKVSAVGNPIIIKKDTIEYNANSFKTTENDVLEDLLKKLPGVEIDDDGGITVNGQSINKITIEGKTFFLDDPQIASKNLPAKIIDKVKVIEKKSEQAEFTGIDDGNEEFVIDLGIKEGMMKGLLGNFMAGGGYDLPSNTELDRNVRFQGTGFVGNFKDNTQISVIANANNTNNRGFNDLAGSMMGGMRGGRGMGGFDSDNGEKTTYMIGANAASNFFDDRMELGGNYMFSGSKSETNGYSLKETFLDGSTLISRSGSDEDRNFNNNNTYGHRVGIRLEHKFSDNTSILFEPRINFGGGNYSSSSSTRTSTLYDGATAEELTNDSKSLTSGDNKNLSTSGFLLFRQRLGKAGRTMTVNMRYSYSNNELNGLNTSETNTYKDGQKDIYTPINQSSYSTQNSVSLSGRATYTEPLAEKLFAEVNYSYSWNKSQSDKETMDIKSDGSLEKNLDYSNAVTNEYVDQEIGANLSYQQEGLHAQLGFAAKPTMTHNTTATGASYRVDTTRNVLNWAPQAMLWWDIDENANARVFYRGESSQPSISQLISVPDNTNPLSLRFGNPMLAPTFRHNLNGDFRFSNKETFASFNIRVDGSYTGNPIVNATWYTNGISYTMPVNGPASASANVNFFLNLPIAKSNFSISNSARAGWSTSGSYVGNDINTSDIVKDGALDYEKFYERYGGDGFDKTFDVNHLNSVNIMERFKATYRSDNLELSAAARTRVAISNYQLAKTTDKTTTWNNQVNASINWTWEEIGLTLKANYDYNWYAGYSQDQDDEHVLDAEIQKLLFNSRVTMALKCYDILEQNKMFSVSDAANYHSESVNNILGRYIILSFTYRFGTFGGRNGRRGGPGMGGPGMGGPGMGGPGPRG